MKRFLIVLLMLCGLLSFAGPARAIDDRILVLPPTLHSSSDAGGVGWLWGRSITLYREAVLNASPIPQQDQLALWTGDTLRIDFYDVEAAREWGQQFEADVVVLLEWGSDLSSGRRQVSMQRIDLWSGEVSGPVELPTLELAIAALEADRFVYDTEFTPVRQLLLDAGFPETAYSSPTFSQGLDAVHDYAHQSRTYPPDALIQGIVGTADIEVTISRVGVPIQVKLLKVSPQYQDFEAAFEKALWAVSYTPAQWQGKAVNSVLRTRIRMAPVP